MTRPETLVASTSQCSACMMLRVCASIEGIASHLLGMGRGISADHTWRIHRDLPPNARISLLSSIASFVLAIGMRPDEKDPSWCDHAGVSYARIPHGRLGCRGGLKAPSIF